MIELFLFFSLVTALFLGYRLIKFFDKKADDAGERNIYEDRINNQALRIEANKTLIRELYRVSENFRKLSERYKAANSKLKTQKVETLNPAIDKSRSPEERLAITQNYLLRIAEEFLALNESFPTHILALDSYTKANSFFLLLRGNLLDHWPEIRLEIAKHWSSSSLDENFQEGFNQFWNTFSEHLQNNPECRDRMRSAVKLLGNILRSKSEYQKAGFEDVINWGQEFLHAAEDSFQPAIKDAKTLVNDIKVTLKKYQQSSSDEEAINLDFEANPDLMDSADPAPDIPIIRSIFITFKEVKLTVKGDKTAGEALEAAAKKLSITTIFSWIGTATLGAIGSLVGPIGTAVGFKLGHYMGGLFGKEICNEMEQEKLNEAMDKWQKASEKHKVIRGKASDQFIQEIQGGTDQIAASFEERKKELYLQVPSFQEWEDVQENIEIALQNDTVAVNNRISNWKTFEIRRPRIIEALEHIKAFSTKSKQLQKQLKEGSSAHFHTILYRNRSFNFLNEGELQAHIKIATRTIQFKNNQLSYALMLWQEKVKQEYLNHIQELEELRKKHWAKFESKISESEMKVKEAKKLVEIEARKIGKKINKKKKK